MYCAHAVSCTVKTRVREPKFFQARLRRFLSKWCQVENEATRVLKQVCHWWVWSTWAYFWYSMHNMHNTCVLLPYGIGNGIINFKKEAIITWVYVGMQVQGYIDLHVICLIARALFSFY